MMRRRKNPKNWKFKVRWVGYEPEKDLWLDWTAVKDLAALDEYGKEHSSVNWVETGKLVEQRSMFLQKNQLGAKCRELVDTLLQKARFWSRNSVENLSRV